MGKKKGVGKKKDGRRNNNDASQKRGRNRKSSSYAYNNNQERQFKEQLMQLGLKIHEVQGDGNCMFRSLSFQLTGSEVYFHRLRLDVMDFIEKHQDDFAPFVEDDEPFEDYCTRMRNDGEWGGHLELLAVARLKKVNLVIHQLQQPRFELHGCDARKAPEMHVSYHDGDHYNAVRMHDDPCEGPATKITLSKTARSSKPKPANPMVTQVREALCDSYNICDGEVEQLLEQFGDHVMDCVDYIRSTCEKLDVVDKPEETEEAQHRSSNKHRSKKSIREKKAAAKLERQIRRTQKRKARMGKAEASQAEPTQSPVEDDNDLSPATEDLGSLKI